MLKPILYIALSLATFSAQAITINCTAGKLSETVSDKTVVSLDINGTINAFDFKFIADSLTQLQTLNMGKCTIEACESSKPIFVNARSFASNTIPTACFAGSHIANITLPASATVIGESAFFGCDNLEHIVLPEQIDSIAAYAFSASGIKDITLPASVTHVGEGAFSHCTALSAVTISDNSRKANITIGKEAFIGCTALASANLGKSVSEIQQRAFSGCSNEALTITVGENCALATIGEGAFMGSGISTFNFANCPKLKVIPKYAFATSHLREVAIPESITHISEGAFYYGTHITSIDLGNCASSISALQFAGCNGATTTGINHDTNEISNYAFYGWNQTNKLVLPEAMASIGDYAFANMTSLEKITSINSEAPALGEAVFSGITPSNVLLTTKADAAGYRTGEQWKDFKHTLNGDADNNSEININDITTIVSHINGKTPNNFLYEAADANVDDAVNDSDVSTVVSTIATANKSAATQTSTSHLQCGDIVVVRGEHTDVNIALVNAVDFSAFQCDITIPADSKFITTDGKTISASPRFTDSHCIIEKPIADNKVRVIAYSTANASFSNDSQALFSYKITGLSPEQESNGVITVDNIIFSQVDSNDGSTNCIEHHFADLAINTTFTGIDAPTINGMKIYASGLHIIVLSPVDTTLQLTTAAGITTKLTVNAGKNVYDAAEPGIYIVGKTKVAVY